MNNFKLKIAAFVLGVSLLCVGGWFYLIPHEPKTLQEFFGKPEYESIDIKKPINTQRTTVEIAGRTFSIPKVYIQSDLRGKRNQDGGVNLLYVMPDFTSRLDFKNRGEYYQAEKEGLMAHMMIQSAKLKIPFEKMIENRKKNSQLSSYEGNHYGLEKYVDIGAPNRQNLRFDDTYLELDKEGKVISFTSCSREGKVPFPGCGHVFHDKNLYYNIYYNKKNFLPAWQEHRRKAIAFIDSFEIRQKKE